MVERRRRQPGRSATIFGSPCQRAAVLRETPAFEAVSVTVTPLASAAINAVRAPFCDIDDIDDIVRNWRSTLRYSCARDRHVGTGPWLVPDRKSPAVGPR